jgi:hypothetical protein
VRSADAEAPEIADDSARRPARERPRREAPLTRAARTRVDAPVGLQKNRPMRAVARAIALGLALWAAPSFASVWLWTDGDGVVRYTTHPEHVPLSARGSLTEVTPGMALPPPPAQAAAASAPASAAPAPSYAPPEGVGFEADPFNAPGQASRPAGQEIPDAPQAAPASVAAVAPAPVAAAPPAPVAAAPPVPVTAAPPGSRRAELEAQIARDEAALKELISQPTDANAPVEASPELREIARRLPALQAELRALEEAQARAATP